MNEGPSTGSGLPAEMLAAILLSVSCGAPLMKLPSGPGSPPPGTEGASAYAQAIDRCSSIRTLTAEVAVSGSAAGHRVRGRMVAGVQAPDSARLEAVAS